MFPIALKYRLDCDRVFQQDGARPHSHSLTQQWHQDNFPSFIDNGGCPANNLDLNPLRLFNLARTCQYYQLEQSQIKKQH